MFNIGFIFKFPLSYAENSQPNYMHFIKIFFFSIKSAA